MSKDNRQVVFSKVYLALLQQGVPSTAPHPTKLTPRCRYRGDDGNKCAIGHLIPDTMYDEKLEGWGVEAGIMQSTLQKIFPESNEELGLLLHCLQNAHDTFLVSKGLDAWKAQMHNVAKKFELEIPNAAV